MRKIIILGLNSTCPEIDREELINSEVWTLNDWYRPYPFLKHPSRVYQIHTDIDNIVKERQKECPDRWINWDVEYVKSNAEIVTLEKDLRFLNQRVLNPQLLMKKYGAAFFSQSFSYMAAGAINEKIQSVKMVGFSLMERPEYFDCFPQCIFVADAMINAGIEVESKILDEWRKKQAELTSNLKEHILNTKQESWLCQDMYGLKKWQ